MAANGMVGSSQCRCSPTSTSRNPSRPVQPQEQNMARPLAGIGPRFGQAPQHRLPRLQRVQRPPGQRTADRLDPVAGGLVQCPPLRRPAGRAAVRAASPAVRRCAPGPAPADRPPGRRPRSAGTRRIPWNRMAARALARRWCGPAPAGGPGAGTPPTGWAGPARRRRIRDRPHCIRLAQSDGGSALAACNAASSGATRAGRSATRSSSRLPQAAGAGPAALRAPQPAAEFRRLAPRQRRRERAVGGIEHVVALVEHVPGRHGVVVQPAPGRLGHHQRMVRDHQFGGAGAADRVFDEAAAPVRAGGMDALAAAVGQRGDQRRRRAVPAASRADRRPGRRRRRVAIAQRAIRPSGMTCWFMKPLAAVLTASSRFSRHR